MEYTFRGGARLRPAGEADMAELFPMVADLYTEPGDAPRREEPLRLTLAEAARHPDKLWVGIVTQEEAAIGYCILCFFWSHEFAGNLVEVDELYFKPLYRSQGLGKELLAALPQLYPQAVGLTLCTNYTNQRAAKFYARAGFSPSPFLHLLWLRG